MQRMFNVTKWRALTEGQALTIDNERARVVRVEVNAPQPAGLYLFNAGNGAAVFLARVVGRDTIEFYSDGKFTLVSDGEVYVYTADGETVHHESVDPVIFTRITERRQVNPEIRRIQEVMNLNIERRLAAQRDEFNAAIRRMQYERAAAAAEARKAKRPLDASEDVDGTGEADESATAAKPAAGEVPDQVGKRRGAAT